MSCLVAYIKKKKRDALTWSSHAFLLLYITAVPKLLAGLMPVPVIGMVARWTTNTANPIGSGTKTYTSYQCVNVKQNKTKEQKIFAYKKKEQKIYNFALRLKKKLK